jgi:protein gp37
MREERSGWSEALNRDVFREMWEIRRPVPEVCISHSYQYLACRSLRMTQVINNRLIGERLFSECPADHRQ